MMLNGFREVFGLCRLELANINSNCTYTSSLP